MRIFRRVLKICEKRLLDSFVSPSLRIEKLGSHWTVFRENLRLEYFFFVNPLRKLKFDQSMARIRGNLHGDQNTFPITYCSVLCKMEMFEPMALDKH